MKVLRRSTSVEAFVERDIPPLPSPPRSCGIKDLGEGGISLGGAAHPPGFLLRHEQGRPTSPTSVTQGLRYPGAKGAAFNVTGNVTPGRRFCVCCSDSRTGLIRAKEKPARSPNLAGFLQQGGIKPSNAEPEICIAHFPDLNLIKDGLGKVALIWFRVCATKPTT